MSRDLLYLINPGFEDPEKRGRFFVCPHSNVIEGLLRSFPGLATQIEVIRLPFAEPRHRLIDLLGDENQSLPLLVFDDTVPVPPDVKVGNGHRFLDDTRRILDVLAERYDFPNLHD